ncbi:phytanoyl-CoA dioxygenase family protein [Nocardia brasiliensis]|uniref:phytanoyl-CoA dioxygenase family protein n=1 Tax=Nocardia brasiliensis TaxID=37326 RepID=UPI0018932B27|nr:phytanoyl-CoA dioxygenase family protein [Nocardia brasiliensis]MBF6126603.1 phytanoyl-CoA dioxygenase family protein [Nocardia brasiliensis]
MKQVVLSESDIARFEADGFLRLPAALDDGEVSALLAGIAKLQADGAANDDSRAWWREFHDGALTPQARESFDFRNVAMSELVFEDLVDAPRILVPIVQILGPRIALLSSHAAVRAPVSDLTVDQLSHTRLGWHRDLGISSVEMMHPQPRLAVKAAIWLTPLTGPAQGAMRVVPGSHRLKGDLAFDELTNQPHGAIDMLADAGDIVLFEQRLWHTATPNILGQARVSLFYCYGYRWLRPQDYGEVEPARLDRMDAVRKQLFGAKATVMGHHLPTSEDVPLAARLAQWQGECL